MSEAVKRNKPCVFILLTLGAAQLCPCGAWQSGGSQTVPPAPFGNRLLSPGLNPHNLPPTTPFDQKLVDGTYRIDDIDVLWTFHSLPQPGHPGSGISGTWGRTLGHELHWSLVAWNPVS